MPTTAELEACSVWTGPVQYLTDGLVVIGQNNTPRLTFTGIVFRPVRGVLYKGIVAITQPNVFFDRFMVDGLGCEDATGQAYAGMQNGIQPHATRVAGKKGWIINCKDGGAEVHAIGAYTAAKHHYWEDIYCEALAMGMLYSGGADPIPANGTQDPSDICLVRVSSTKKLEWMTAAAGVALSGMKCNYESKNIRRLFAWTCAQHRNAATSQNGYGILFQNLLNQMNNGPYNQIDDIVFHNHWMKAVGKGVVLVAQTTDSAAPIPDQPGSRHCYDNFFLEDHGNDWGHPSNNGTLLGTTGDMRNVEFSRWTYLMNGAKTAKIWLYYGDGPYGKAFGLTIRDFAGAQAGIYYDPAFSSDVYGIPGLSAYADNYLYAGNVGFGSIPYAGTYTPGNTNYADAASMGFNTTTGVLSSPGNVVGTNGGCPGVDFVQFSSSFASMASWAFSR